MKEKVVVGLSGGVDSSVAAWMLKQQGYDLTGLFMINWHDTEGTLSGDCPWHDDVIFARLVARRLDIPFEVVDLSDSYRKKVVDYMFDEYRCGRTPNPDVLCNREIKFDLFAQTAFSYGAQYVATGHYCRKDEIMVRGVKTYRLLSGTDPGKDQSYFLCQLSQQQLSTALFPVGHLLKSEVRRIAEENGLASATKKDSQGICFVGKVDLPVFLQQKLDVKEGKIIEIPADFREFKREVDETDRYRKLAILSAPYRYRESDGIIAGKHHGAHFYTIGQRKGLNVGGKKEPLFVIGIDTVQNIVYTGQGESHPGLYRSALFIANPDVHWIRPDLAMADGEDRRFAVRIRYRQPLQQATLYQTGEGMYILFDTPQRGIAPGQFATWYQNDELIGSGVIH